MKDNRPVASSTPETAPDNQLNHRAVFFCPDLMIDWPAAPPAEPPSATLESVPEPSLPTSPSPAAELAEPLGTRRRQPDEMPAYFVPRALAKRWHVCVDKVLRFIQTGELRAFNVASKESRRPRYRISMEEVRRFEEQTRSAAAPRAATSTSPRRRKPSSAAQSPRSYF